MENIIFTKSVENGNPLFPKNPQFVENCVCQGICAKLCFENSNKIGKIKFLKIKIFGAKIQTIFMDEIFVRKFNFDKTLLFDIFEFLRQKWKIFSP